MTAITDLSDYRRQREQESRRPELATVLRDSDPEDANCSHYLIFHEDRDAVQDAITSLIAEVESFGNGEGKFLNPRRRGGLWFSFGEVVVQPDVVTEFGK